MTSQKSMEKSKTNLHQQRLEDGNSEKCTETLINTYGTLKSDILEAMEELKMRRSLDQENETKVNSLITEKFELKRQKDEKLSALIKERDSLNQQSQKIKQEFEKKMVIQEEDKAAQLMSINSSSKGIKSLKDEILSLQLVKHSLEKKVKDYEHELLVERRSKSELAEKVKAFRQSEEQLSQQCADMTNRLDYLASLVVKTKEMHARLTEVNDHHGTMVNNYQVSNRSLQQQLVKCNAELTLLKEEKSDHSKTFPCAKFPPNKKQMIELDEQQERELETLREQKQFLMTSLKEANRLQSLTEGRMVGVEEKNALLHTSLDDLKQKVDSLTDEKIVLEKEMSGLQENLILSEQQIAREIKQREDEVTSLKSELNQQKSTNEDIIAESNESKNKLVEQQHLYEQKLHESSLLLEQQRSLHAKMPSEQFQAIAPLEYIGNTKAIDASNTVDVIETAPQVSKSTTEMMEQGGSKILMEQMSVSRGSSKSNEERPLNTGDKMSGMPTTERPMDVESNIISQNLGSKTDDESNLGQHVPENSSHIQTNSTITKTSASDAQNALVVSINSSVSDEKPTVDEKIQK